MHKCEAGFKFKISAKLKIFEERIFNLELVTNHSYFISVEHLTYVKVSSNREISIVNYISAIIL